MKEKILLILFLAAGLLLISCSDLFNQKNSSQKDFTVTITGAINTDIHKSTYLSRSAFPSIPENIYYTVTATETSSTAEPKTTVEGTVINNGSTATFTIRLSGSVEGKTWSIKANGYKTRTENEGIISFSDLILTGTKDGIVIDQTTNNYSGYFDDLSITVIPYIAEEASSGSVELPVTIENNSIIKSCVAKWTEGTGDSAVVKSQTLTFTNQTATFTMIPDSDSRTTTPAGIYDVNFYFYTDDTSTKRLVGYVKETVNVYTNLITTFWEDNSVEGSDYLQNNNGTLKLYFSNSAVTNFEKNTRFVDETNGSDVASGSYLSPFNSITKAFNVIKELYTSVGTNSPEYVIFLKSDVTQEAEAVTNADQNYAFLNVSMDTATAENKFKLKIASYNAQTPYKIDANRSSTHQGRVIFVGENAELTLNDIQISGGYFEETAENSFPGSGIYKNSTAILRIGGKILIKDNFYKEWDYANNQPYSATINSNLYLGDGDLVYVVSALTGSEIHITTEKKPDLAGSLNGVEFTGYYSNFNNGENGSPQYPGLIFISDEGYNIATKAIDIRQEAALILSGGEINTHFAEPIKFYVNKTTIESSALEVGENGTDASYEKRPRTITCDAWSYFEDDEGSTRRKNWNEQLQNITMLLRTASVIKNDSSYKIIATANQTEGVNTNNITVPYGLIPGSYMLEISADITDDYGIKNRYSTVVPITVEDNFIAELQKSVYLPDEEISISKIIFKEDDYLLNNKEYNKNLYKNNTLLTFDGHMPEPSQDLTLELGITIDGIMYAKRIAVLTISFPADIVSTSDGLLENNSTFSSGTLTINPSVLLDSENQTYSKIPDKTTFELVNSNNDSVFIYDLVSTNANDTFSLNIPVDLDGGLYKLIITRIYKGITNTLEKQFTKYSPITSFSNILNTTFEKDKIYSFNIIDNTVTNSNLVDMISTVGVSSGCLELDLSNLSNLTTLNFYSATNNLHKIKSLILPDSLTTIAHGALYQAKNLETITIPASVTIISSSALHTCSALKKVIFAPRTQTLTIHEVSFAGTGLETITIPKEAVYGPVSPNSVFRGSNKLKEFIIEEGNTCFKTAHNNEILLINSGKTLLDWPAAEGDIKEEYFENPIEIISRSCFEGNKNMTSIEIPASVTKICGSAFYGAAALTTVTFKDPDNWYVGSSDVPTAATISSYTPLDLSDTAQNVQFLTKYSYSGGGGYAEKTFHHYIPE